MKKLFFIMDDESKQINGRFSINFFEDILNHREPLFHNVHRNGYYDVENKNCFNIEFLNEGQLKDFISLVSCFFKVFIKEDNYYLNAAY